MKEMDKKKKLITVCMILFFASCFSMSDDAKLTITKSLDLLVKKNVNGFYLTVLPKQREKFKQFIFSAPFFTSVISYQIEDASDAISDTKEQALVLFRYPSRTIATMWFYLIKQDGKWYIDMQETYDKAIKRNGQKAFYGIQFKN